MASSAPGTSLPFREEEENVENDEEEEEVGEGEGGMRRKSLVGSASGLDPDLWRLRRG